MPEIPENLPPHLEVQLSPTQWKRGDLSIKNIAEKPLSTSESSRGLSPNVSFFIGRRSAAAIPPVDLRPELKQAKDLERSAVFEAYKEARVDSRNQVRSVYANAGRQFHGDTNDIVFGQISLHELPKQNFPLSTIKEITNSAVAREIVRKAKLLGKPIDEQRALQMAQKLGASEREKIGKFPEEDPVLNEKEAVWLYDAAQHNQKLAEKKLSRDYRELCTIMTEIDGLIAGSQKESSKEKLAEVNKKILTLLRKAIQSEAYIFLCKDESIPAIAYLHRLVMASFIEPTPLAMYKNIAAPMLKSPQIPPDLTRGNFRPALENVHKVGGAHKLAASDKTASYVLENPLSTFSSLKSEMPALGPVLGGILGPYDPRKGENAAGTMFTEGIRTASGAKALTFMYSPTPTIGNEVSPETEAFLQALENRQFMSQTQLAKEPAYAQHTHWAYTSLQNTEAKNEGPRTKAILDLNNRFPLSFTGISVTQDSDFYKGGVHGTNEKERTKAKIENGDPPLSPAYKEKMKKELFEKKSGYFFPPGDLKGDFEKEYGAIVDTAYEIVTTSQMSVRPSGGDEEKLWQWRQKSAFRELVNVGIMRYWQLRSLPEKGQGIVTSCCKECIDRGGKTMAELLWALGDGKQQTLEQIFAAICGRALLARNRLILPNRLEPFLDVTEFVSQEAAHEFLTKTIGTKVDSSFSQTPAQPLTQKTL